FLPTAAPRRAPLRAARVRSLLGRRRPALAARGGGRCPSPGAPTMSLTVVSVSYALAEVGPDAVGGAEQVLTLLDRALHRLGHRSVVVAPAGSTVAGQHVASGAGPAAFGPAAREEANARQAALLRDTLARVKADVIHLHSVDLSALLRACGETPTL